MKASLLSTMKHVALIFSVLLVSCTTDVYEPKPEPEPNPNPGSGGYVDNVFTTNKSKTLTVNIEDAYDGKYYYTVEAYMGNPAVDENAKMIAGSGQKMNSKVPYSISLSFPAIMRVLYIRVTDPFKRVAVYAFDIAEGDMVCNIGKSEITTKSTTSQLRSNNVDFPEIDYSYEKDYTVLSGKKDMILVKGKVYVIEKGSAFSGGLTFPGEGNVSLYVAGTWDADLGNNIQLETNTKIYVLNGGKIEKAKGNGKLSLVGTTIIAIEKGGDIGGDKDNSEFSISMTNSTRIINEGDVDFKDITMDSDATIYNDGEFDADKLSTQNDGNRIINTREFEVDIMTMTNGFIDNYCDFDVETKLDVLANGEINVMPGAYMEVKHLNAQGLTLRMDAKSMWVGEKASFKGQQSIVQGNDTDNALFKVKNIDIQKNSGIMLKYEKKINIEFENHTSHPDEWNPCYSQGSDAAFSVGQGFVKIEKNDCNRNGGNHNPGEGGGDGDSDYEEVNTLPYVYMFEDNWPYVGDYDMNDLVIGVQIKNKKSKDKTVSAKIIATVYAVGATKQLGAALQLDGVRSSLIPGAEANQENAVLWLFKDAHEVLGTTERTPLNTTKITQAPKVVEMDLQFTAPMSEVITVDNVNLFTVTGDMDGDKRNEIHVAGFKGTNKAKQQSEFCTEIYTSKENNLMWGLCVPQDETTSYPKERVYIGDAYAGFGEWVKGSGVPNWYKVTSDNKEKIMNL